MKITSFFTNVGNPQTGLSPVINLWTFDGTQVVEDESMTEIGGGFYYYEYGDYNEDLDYVILSDGGATLSASERYVYASNETAGVGKILQIEKGNWEIKGNQMLFYSNDGTTPIYTFNLQTKNGSPTEKDVFRRTGV